MKKKIFIALLLFAAAVAALFVLRRVRNGIISAEVGHPPVCGYILMPEDGNTVYWKKPENVDGYQIWRSYTGGRLCFPIAEVEESKGGEYAATGFYTDSEFNRSKKTVYYKVRAFRIIDGKKVYSYFSPQAEVAYNDGVAVPAYTIAMPSGTERTLYAFSGWSLLTDGKWESSDSSVAEVSPEGVLTAKSAGTATVSCTAPGGAVGYITVYVDRQEAEPLDTYVSRFEQNPDSGVYEQTKAGFSPEGDAVIMLAGDLLCMGGPQRAMLYDEGYNFNESFDFARSIFERCDLAVGNLETMIASEYSLSIEENRYEGMPVCNAPARYLDALCYCGFDGLVMANNHNCDTWPAGVIKTIGEVESYGFGHTGLFTSTNDRRWLMYDVNGIKVGFLAYVGGGCHYNSRDAGWTDAEKDSLLNYYSPEKAAADIAELKTAGADYVFVYMHWGATGHYTIKEEQLSCATELAELGADYIVGAHPHLIQPYDELVTSDGRVVPCIYSLGDFNGYINQVPGNLDTALLRVKLHMNADGSVELAENNYISLYLPNAFEGRKFPSLPLSAALNGGYDVEGGDEIRARIKTFIGDKIEELTELP